MKGGVTHILRDWVEFEQTKRFTGYCGCNSSAANYLSIREVMGAPPENHNEVYLSDKDRQKYVDTLCPECLEHEEVAMAILGL